MNGPIHWFGGKGKMTPKLLQLIPPHTHYAEPFGGGASLLFAKPPCGGVETYNDIDDGLVNFFRVLRDPDTFAQFYHRATMTLYARSEYNVCRSTWREQKDEIEKAYRWFVVARMSFGGRFSASWGTVISAVGSKMANTTSAWLACLRRLPQIHARMESVQIECVDWREILRRYNAPGTLLYCDPPYVDATRKAGKYQHELSTEDHRELIAMLLEYPQMVMLSGYRHETYAPLDAAAWRRWDFQTSCHAAGRTRHTGILGKGAALKMQPRTECVWLNPAAVSACHSITGVAGLPIAAEKAEGGTE